MLSTRHVGMKMTKQPLVLLQSLTKTSALSLVNTRWFSESSRSKMKIIETVEEFHAIRRKLPSGVTLGFVPTMGGLHEGHMSLIRKARANCEYVASSVFVNPTQFGPNEDFSKYPRSFESDMALLRKEKVDFVFYPSAEIMYPKDHRCFVVPEGFDNLPEGVCRPGHFRGVATIVAKLFNTVMPTHAYFGEKDAAQCVLIKRLAEDLNMGIEIITIPVSREQDGLARSTRNQYLNPEERKAASVVYRGLCSGKDIFEAASASFDANLLRDAVRKVYEKEPLVKEIQYISVGSKKTMEELKTVRKNEGAVLSVAVKLGKCRLIDAMML